MRKLSLLVAATVASAALLGSRPASAILPAPLDPTKFDYCPKYDELHPPSYIGVPHDVTPTNARDYDVVVDSTGSWAFVSYFGGVHVFQVNGSGVLVFHHNVSMPGAKQISGMALAGTKLLATDHDSTGSQDSNLWLIDISALPATPATAVTMPAGAGSIEVRPLANNTLAIVANEYGNSLTVVDLVAKTKKQTLPIGGLAHHPVGLAIGQQGTRLWVACEDAANGAAPGVGALLMVNIDTTQSQPLSVHGTPRNGGCGAARVVLDGNGHIFVAARDSNAIFVFNNDDTWNGLPGLRSFVITGRQPLGMAFKNGVQTLLVANSNRAGDSAYGPFLQAFDVGQMIQLPQPSPPPLPTTWWEAGAFARQLAVSGSNVYLTNFDDSTVYHYVIP